MTPLIVLIILSILGTLGLGIWMNLKPGRRPQPGWMKLGVIANLAVFFMATAAVLILGTQAALAQETVSGVHSISMATAVAILGVGLPTAAAIIGAAIALGPVGAASLAVIAEKPELFGRTLIYMGLAEGLAIYGLVVSILLLGKL